MNFVHSVLVVLGQALIALGRCMPPTFSKTPFGTHWLPVDWKRNVRGFLCHGWMPLALFAALLSPCSPFGAVPEQEDPPSNLPLLTKAIEVRRLTEVDAQRRFPVQLSGTVTYYDPDWNLLFLSDPTAGIYLHIAGESLDLVPGQSLVVEGSTDRGEFSPIVTRLRIHSGERAPLPIPKAIPIPKLLAGSEDCEYVETVGTVTSVTEAGSHLKLALIADGHGIEVSIPHAAQAEAAALLNSTVRVRGVCSVRRSPALVVLFVSSLTEVTVLKRGESTPLALVSRPIRDLTNAPANDVEGPVRTDGIVVQQLTPNEFVIRDESGSLRVRSRQTNALAANIHLDLTGQLRWETEVPVLQDAIFRKIGVGLTLPEEESKTSLRKSLKGVETRVLTQAASLRALSNTDAESGFPAVLRGTITYYDYTNNDCFIQDNTGGIWIDVESAGVGELDLIPGEFVAVSGYSSPGFAPGLLKPHFQLLGQGRMPERDPAPLTALLTGKEDGQWVKVIGIIRAVERVWNGIQVELEMANGGRLRSTIACPASQPLPEAWVAATVEIQGVCVTTVNHKRQLIGVRLLVPQISQVRLRVPAEPNPYALPVRPINQLLQYRADGQGDHRVHVQGVVTLRRPDKTLYIHDSSDGVQVQAQQELDVKPGDLVEVVGFPTVGEFTPVLQNAVGRRIGEGQMPEVRPVAVSVLSAGQFDSDLVQVEATFLERTTHLEEIVYTVESEDRVFTAVVPKTNGLEPMRTLRQGTPLTLTGICSVQTDENQAPKSFRLLLRDGKDLKVHPSPAIWLRAYATRWIGALCFISLTAFTWVALLRIKVRQQTELVRQKLLREAALEERYRQLFENTNDLVFSLDFQGNWLSLNQATQRLLGYTWSELEGRTAFDLIAPAHHGLVREAMHRTKTGDQCHTHEWEVNTRVHGRLILEVSCKLHLNEGQAVGLDCIARDISDRKRSEAALRESEERFRNLVENSPEGIFIQTEGRFAYLNSAAVRLFEAKSQTDLINTAVLDLCHPDFRESIQQRIELLNDGRQSVPWVEEKFLRINGKSFEVEVSATPITFKGKPGALVFFRDVSEHKRLEEQLRQAQKMEAVGQLAGGVAHDFNNILAATFMRLDMTAMDPTLTPDLQASIRELREDAKRAAELTKQLLLFSRRHALNMKVINLNEVVDHLLKMLRRLLGEHIELQFRTVSAAVWVNADVGMIEQVVMNLAVNARDAMPDGGHLRISTRVVEIGKQSPAVNPEARLGQFACLSVADTGCGMDTETLARIFEPFFTTKGVGKGTGLGLSTVYGIAKQHQGWIEVVSAPGKGTTFNVFLPSSQPEPLLPATASEEAGLSGGHESILVVEDDDSLRRTTEALLRSAGYVVMAASNATEAFKLLEPSAVRIDLLLTDMVMPGGMNGLELSREMLHQRKGLKVLLTSGYSLELSTPRLFPAGQIHFLPKPCDPKLLLRTIRATLDGKEERASLSAQFASDDHRFN